jgi:hypothetical protein
MRGKMSVSAQAFTACLRPLSPRSLKGVVASSAVRPAAATWAAGLIVAISFSYFLFTQLRFLFIGGPCYGLRIGTGGQAVRRLFKRRKL